MRYCPKCNFPLDENGFCPRCASSGNSSQNSSDPPKDDDKDLISILLDKLGFRNLKPADSASIRRPADPPQEIAIDSEELLFRNYHICDLKGKMGFASAEGRIVITSRRLIFVALDRVGGKAKHDNQVSIDEVAGLEVHRGRRFRAPNFFLAIMMFSLCFFAVLSFVQMLAKESALVLESVLTIGAVGCAASIAALFLLSKIGQRLATVLCACSVAFVAFASDAAPRSPLIGILTIVTALVTILQFYMASFISNLAIIVKSKGGGQGAIVISRSEARPGAFGSDLGERYSEVLETKETSLAQREIYLIVHDIKANGDTYAYDKWVDIARV
jgi:hypothetical protein